MMMKILRAVRGVCTCSCATCTGKHGLAGSHCRVSALGCNA